MTMKLKLATHIAAITLALVADTRASDAPPQGPFVWFGSGEVLYPVGEFSPAMHSMAPILGDSRSAWKCQHVTLLGAALWSWDCQPVASHPQMLAWAPLPPELTELVARETPLSSARRSIWNRHGGVGLLALILLLPIGVARWRANGSHARRS